MGFIKSGLSAIGKFFIVLALAAAFIVGMVGVVYMSLKGEEVVIPEIVGKDFKQSEAELAALGLKIRRIANRYSEEPPNTILEQRPRAGSTAKTGLMISVIVAQPNPEGSEAPAEVKKKADDEEAIEEIEELISDKPKKASNKATTKKKTSTTRDVIANKPSDNSDSADKSNSNSNSKSNSSGTPVTPKENKNAAPTPKPAVTPAANVKKPAEPTKPGSGDTRPRRATPPSN